MQSRKQSLVLGPIEYQRTASIWRQMKSHADRPRTVYLPKIWGRLQFHCRHSLHKIIRQTETDFSLQFPIACFPILCESLSIYLWCNLSLVFFCFDSTGLSWSTLQSWTFPFSSRSIKFELYELYTSLEFRGQFLRSLDFIFPRIPRKKVESISTVFCCWGACPLGTLGSIWGDHACEEGDAGPCSHSSGPYL